MNPNREADSIRDGYIGWTRYTVNGEIQGFHALFDNQDLIMECLYGYYKLNEPWVRVDLKPFADITNQ
jgi:hypothetical protein